MAMVRKVAKVGAVKTERNWSRSERKVGVSCMSGLLVARDPGCCATPRIHPWPKEDAIEHAYSPSPEVRNPNSVPNSCSPAQVKVPVRRLPEIDTFRLVASGGLWEMVFPLSGQWSQPGPIGSSAKACELSDVTPHCDSGIADVWK